MHHSCEATAICPTSLEMRPCTCSDKYVSARLGLDALIAAHCHPWPLLCITPLAPSRALLHPALIALAALLLGAAALCTPSTGPSVWPVLAHTLERAVHCRASRPDGRCMGPPSTLTDPQAADQRPCALLIPVALDVLTRQRAYNRARVELLREPEELPNTSVSNREEETPNIHLTAHLRL